MERRDFFISYQNCDEAWAVWIDRVLNANGYSTYTQALDILPGDNFLTKMNDFLENSANFIAVWSESYSKSWYCMREMEAAFKACHEGLMGCLLPVRIDRYPMKLLYAALVHVDLFDMGATSGAMLMNAVRRAVPYSLYEQERAREENGQRLCQLGDNYYYGRGVIINYALARYYYEQAAQQGNATAMNALGYIYQNGLGVYVDYAMARRYYEQAAQQDNATAFFNLGCLYECGQGVYIDYERALYYYQQSADISGAKWAFDKVIELRARLNR